MAKRSSVNTQIMAVMRDWRAFAKSLDRQAMQNAATEAADIMNAALQAAAPVAPKDATITNKGRKVNVPKGTLKDLIKTFRFKKSWGLHVGVEITTDLYKIGYAHFTEYGSERSPAQPWFRPTARKTRSRCKAVLKKGMSHLITIKLKKRRRARR